MMILNQQVFFSLSANLYNHNCNNLNNCLSTNTKKNIMIAQDK